MTTTTIHLLPRLGLCPACEGEIRVRNNGTLYRHDQPSDPDAPIVCDSRGFQITTCWGSARTPVRLLEATFARWLYAHRHRDPWTDPVGQLGDLHFNGCTRTRTRTPADVEWTTAEELHQRRHDIQRRHTGSDVLAPCSGQHCDWHCRQISDAAAEFEVLLAGAAP